MSRRIDKFLSVLESRPHWFPYARGIRENIGTESNVEKLLLEWAELCLGDNWAKTLAEGYVAFVSDVNRCQLRYEVSGHYLNQNYDQVYSKVYGNERFMQFYHWGVYVSTFAWAHHLELVSFFNNRFLKPYFSGADNKRLVDLGCGSGIWSFLSLKHSEGLASDGIDISETSCSFTQMMANQIGFRGRFNLHCADAMSWGGAREIETFDGAISCFLLEHLETPAVLLENLSRLVRPRGIAFVTCALTAAETDHIKEFRRETEVLAMAESAGFRVVEMFSAAPRKYRGEARFLPRSMAMVLSKRAGEIW